MKLEEIIADLQGMTAVIPETRSLPRVDVTIHGEKIQALLDTGAAVNAIRADVLARYRTLAPKRDQQIRLACGTSTAGSHGIQEVTLTIDLRQYSSSFHVLSDMTESAILGAPFMLENSIVMDFTRKCTYLGTTERHTVYWDAVSRRESFPAELPHFQDLDEPGKQPFTDLLNEFRDLFNDPNIQSTTISTKHTIRLKNQKRVYRKPYPMSDAKKQIFYTQIDEMLHTGVIKPSNSMYSSPPVIIERPGKKPRFCIDYRDLNDNTEDEPSVLPSIFENLRGLGKARVFSILDLKSGYWQIPMDPISTPLTAFTTPDGALYEFTVMPFGLKGAPGTFQRLMTNEVLAGCLHQYCKVYLDDILVYIDTEELHMEHLRAVFERLRLHGLKVSPEKYRIAVHSIEYFGHRILEDSIQPKAKHLETLQNFPPPRMKRKLQSFLCTVNWVREYIKDAAQYTQPLTNLLKKDAKFSNR